MNKAQLSYAVERVGKALHKKEEAIKDKYTTKAKPVTANDVYKAIKDGTVKVVNGQEGTTINSYVDLDDVFDLSSIGYGSVFDSKKATPELEKVRKEAESIKDRLMLGDSQEALALIESFCN